MHCSPKTIDMKQDLLPMVLFLSEQETNLQMPLLPLLPVPNLQQITKNGNFILHSKEDLQRRPLTIDYFIGALHMLKVVTQQHS